MDNGYTFPEANVTFPDITVTVPQGYRSLSVIDCRGITEAHCDHLSANLFVYRQYVEIADQWLVGSLIAAVVLALVSFVWLRWFAVGNLW